MFNSCGYSVELLQEMVLDPAYNVLFVPCNENKWIETENGGKIDRSEEKSIKTLEELADAIRIVALNQGRLYIDPNSKYFEKFPYAGERVKRSENPYDYIYTSCNSIAGYRIRNCTYLFDPPKYIPLSLDFYPDGFSSTCYTIGSWGRTEDGYKFSSCGSRLFETISPEDLGNIWAMLIDADKFLRNRFLKEDQEM